MNTDLYIPMKYLFIDASELVYAPDYIIEDMIRKLIPFYANIKIIPFYDNIEIAELIDFINTRSMLVKKAIYEHEQSEKNAKILLEEIQVATLSRIKLLSLY